MNTGECSCGLYSLTNGSCNGCWRSAEYCNCKKKALLKATKARVIIAALDWAQHLNIKTKTAMLDAALDLHNVILRYGDKDEDF